MRSVLALALAVASFSAIAGERRAYPTVAELEAGLNLAPGLQIPRVVPAGGRGWTATYLGARPVGGIRLR